MIGGTAGMGGAGSPGAAGWSGGAGSPGGAGSRGTGGAQADPDPAIDWAALRAAAVSAMERAYAPYSGFPVGAAGLVDDGRVVVGCNVENASYGLALCAECGMVCALSATGGGRLVAVTVVDRHGDDIMPCGRCRQLIWEHGGPVCLVHTEHGIRPMSQILPDAFDRNDLRTRS